VPNIRLVTGASDGAPIIRLVTGTSGGAKHLTGYWSLYWCQTLGRLLAPLLVADISNDTGASGCQTLDRLLESLLVADVGRLL
jgi:hypothetical protein